MASRELTLQTNIVKSIRQDGGYARRIVDTYQIGVLDLFVALPPFMGTMIEVKHLGPATAPFHRKLKVSSKQRVEIDKLNGPYVREALKIRDPLAPPRVGTVLLVGWTDGRHELLAALPPETEVFFSDNLRTRSQRGTGGYYPAIGHLLEDVGLTKVSPR